MQTQRCHPSRSPWGQTPSKGTSVCHGILGTHRRLAGVTPPRANHPYPSISIETAGAFSSQVQMFIFSTCWLRAQPASIMPT